MCLSKPCLSRVMRHLTIPLSFGTLLQLIKMHFKIKATIPEHNSTQILHSTITVQSNIQWI